jgi:hypothetical protein
MREIRSSGSAEGVMSNHDPYSDSLSFLCSFPFRHWFASKDNFGYIFS